MSLIFIEGWNGYSNGENITTNGWISNISSKSIDYNSGVTTISNSFNFNYLLSSSFLKKLLPTTLLSHNLFCGTGFKTMYSNRIVTILRIGNAQSQYIEFFKDAGGFIGGRANAVFGGGSFVSIVSLVNNIPYYFELGITSTTATFRVNGSIIGNISLTVPIIPTHIDYILVTGTNALGTSYYSDIYCCDDLGDGPFNNFVGPIVVQKAAVVATGTNINFTGSHTDIDETATDSATTKITGSDPNALFTAKLSVPDDNILGYSFRINAQTSVANFLGTSLIEKLDTNEIESTPKIIVPGSNYYWQHQVYREKLPGDLPLTKTNIDAAEFGVKLIDMR